MRARRGLFAGVGWPLVAALLLISAASAQGFGRLFSTPEERRDLDTLRRKGEPSPPETRVSPSHLTVNGLVIRDRGPDSVWINGERVSRSGRTREGIRVQGKAKGARVHVILPHDAGSVLLKAGQNVDLETGSVRDAYEADSDSRPGPRPLPGAEAGDPGR